jgi:hypothetical protein
MADPTSLDSALYRMKAYVALLKQEPPLDKDTPPDPADDIEILIEWIEHAKPLLGAISVGGADYQRLNQQAKLSNQAQDQLQQQMFRQTAPPPDRDPEPA